MNEWHWEPLYQCFAVLEAEQRCAQAEREVQQSAWQIRKLENKIDRLSEKVQRQGGTVRWRDLKRLIALKPYG
jgi:hypothetical protein